MGRRPVHFSITLLLFAVCFIFFSTAAFAKSYEEFKGEYTAMTEKELDGKYEKRYYDDTYKFDIVEKVQFEKAIQDLRDRIDLDVAVVVTDKNTKDTAQDYADDFYDKNGIGSGRKDSGYLLLIDFYNGELWISTHGEAIYYLTDDRIDHILDQVEGDAGNQEFYDVIMKFLYYSEDWITQGIPSDQYTYDEETGEIKKYKAPPTVFHFIILFIISVGAGGIFFGIVNMKYKFRIKAFKYPYKEKSNLVLTKKIDTFVDKRVTYQRIQTPPPSSGSSGGSSFSGGSRSSVHRSSSGRSHGGGGRKF